MRFAIAAAMIVACLPAQAQAAAHLYQYQVTATVTGTQSVHNPNQIGCNGGPPGTIFCTGQGPWTETLTDLPVPLVSTDGTGTFNWGGCHASGCYSGTIIGGFNPDGTPNFSGINFSFAYDNIPGPLFRFGTAATFSVKLLLVDGVPPVPEPATWAMMIVGFGAMGAAMRRRQARVRYA